MQLVDERGLSDFFKAKPPNKAQTPSFAIQKQVQYKYDIMNLFTVYCLFGNVIKMIVYEVGQSLLL